MKFIKIQQLTYVWIILISNIVKIFEFFPPIKYSKNARNIWVNFVIKFNIKSEKNI